MELNQTLISLKLQKIVSETVSAKILMKYFLPVRLPGPMVKINNKSTLKSKIWHSLIPTEFATSPCTGLKSDFERAMSQHPLLNRV